MSSRSTGQSDITPEVLLRAYACGIFPMSESADDPSLFWVEPEQRGIIPLGSPAPFAAMNSPSRSTAPSMR